MVFETRNKMYGAYTLRKSYGRRTLLSTAMGICLVAAIALTRFKVGTIKLIAACALAGLVVSYLP